jgi:hypothetical protein
MAQPALQAAESGDARQAEPASVDLDLSSLMRSCRWAIEEERLHELRIPLANGVPAYVELPQSAELIFINGNQAADLPTYDDNIERFMAAYWVSLLCYDYPYLQYADGSIRRLFLMRAKVEDGRLCPDPDGYLKVNCALLQDQGVKALQIQGLAHQMADPNVPFAEKLQIVAKRLELAEGRFDPNKLDETMPPGARGRMQWRNRPVLASATMAPSISALLRDLNDLSSAEAQQKIAGTALGGIQISGDGAMVTTGTKTAPNLIWMAPWCSTCTAWVTARLKPCAPP